MRISIVSTLFKSAPFVEEFIRRCFSAAEQITNDIEMILVDDGSPDESLSLAKSYRDDRITVVELSRNFGHHRALLAGLSLATGERVFLVDSDLEEAPELLIRFSEFMDTNDADVVFGIHPQSEGSALRRVTSIAFWRFFSWTSDSTTPVDICNVRLMSKVYVNALASLPETNVFLGGLFHWVGFRQLAVPIERSINRKTSTYSFRSRLGVAVRAIVSFSTWPLKLMFWFGAFVASLSCLTAIYFALTKLLYPEVPLGFTAIIISIWFFSGVIIACLGVIGLYIGYMYMETKSRPRVVIRGIHRSAK